MKVFDLGCAAGHRFEGWFSSEDDFQTQSHQGLLTCPLCGDPSIRRMPSAPRLNLSSHASIQPEPALGQENATAPDPGARPVSGEPGIGAAAADPGQMAVVAQSLWLKAVQHVLAHTEDVGRRFPEEARRIHHGEVPSRGIRGEATAQEREALREEGIEVYGVAIPKALTEPRH